jgi:RNA polymerase sigma factor (sigma-70 family)
MQEIVFENLFRAHYTFLYRTSYAVTRRAEDAEDVVQTIFLRLIRREVPPDLEQNPRAYLYRAAVNLSLNSIRSRKRLLFTGDAGRLEVQDCPTAAQSIEESPQAIVRSNSSVESRRVEYPNSEIRARLERPGDCEVVGHITWRNRGETPPVEGTTEEGYVRRRRKNQTRADEKLGHGSG